MNKRQTDHLRHELRLAGASSAELPGLVNIANQFETLKSARRLPTPPRRMKTWRWGLISAASAFAIIAGVFVAQLVLPGNVLYPLQKTSDSLAITLHPSYRGTVMMRRARQVKELVADNAAKNTVMSALADYQSVAAGYRHEPSSYAVFEYCKNNLRQAAEQAPPDESKAIKQTLATLDDV